MKVGINTDSPTIFWLLGRDPNKPILHLSIMEQLEGEVNFDDLDKADQAQLISDYMAGYIMCDVPIEELIDKYNVGDEEKKKEEERRQAEMLNKLHALHIKLQKADEEKRKVYDKIRAQAEFIVKQSVPAIRSKVRTVDDLMLLRECVKLEKTEKKRKTVLIALEERIKTICMNKIEEAEQNTKSPNTSFNKRDLVSRMEQTIEEEEGDFIEIPTEAFEKIMEEDVEYLKFKSGD